MWSHDGLRAESEQVTNTVNEGPVPGRRTRSERLPVQRKAIASAATDLIAPSPAPDLAGLDDPFGFHLPGSPAIQRKAGAADAGATSGGAGRPMPAPVQAKMEHAFGADLSSVRIHEGPQAQAIGALAYTQGTDIHFAPGQYQPDSHAGQELLGHELTHVVQQAQGRVSATGQAKGVGLNDDEGLEREADLAGARAARGEIAMTGGALTGGGSAVVQAKYKLNAQKTNELKREIVKRWSFDDEVAADVAKELAEYCTGHNQALTIIQKASYDDFQLAASSKVPPDDFELELITGGGSKGSGKPKKEVDPLVDVRKRIGKKGHDLSLFTKEDLEGILLTKDEGGWDLAIQTTYQRVLLAKQNAEKRQELIQR